MLFLLVLAHFVHHLLTAIPMPLLPMIRNEFSLDYTQSGLVISAFSLSYGIGQLPAGWFADRIGPRWLITIGICGVAVAGLLVGLSQVYMMMIACLALMGLLGGGYHPDAPPYNTGLVRTKNLGQGLGLHMIGGSASFFLAPIIAVSIASKWGWNGAFVGLALPTLLFGLLIYLLLGQEASGPRPEALKGAAGEVSSLSGGRLRRLSFFIVLATFTGALFLSVISFIPLYLVDRHDVSEETAGALIGLIYSAGLWVGPLAGHLSDRLGRIPMILGIGFMGGPIIFLLNLLPYGWGFFILLVCIGMIVYVRMPVSESYIVRQTTPRNRSTILGIYYFGTMEGGGILTPAIGYLIDHLGFALSFTVTAGLLVFVTFVCALGMRFSRRPAAPIGR